MGFIKRILSCLSRTVCVTILERAHVAALRSTRRAQFRKEHSSFPNAIGSIPRRSTSESTPTYMRRWREGEDEEDDRFRSHHAKRRTSHSEAERTIGREARAKVRLSTTSFKTDSYRSHERKERSEGIREGRCGRTKRRSDREGRHFRSRSRERKERSYHERSTRYEDERHPDSRSIHRSHRHQKEAVVSELPPGVNFELSGLLAEEQNTYLGIVLKFTEPPEAQKPTERWRLYVFREGKQLGDPLMLHEESCYLFGMNSAIADVRLDHPSCDEQHAVLQYRSVEREDEDRMPVQVVIPYLMDLESKAGTYINGDRIEPRRYYEILEKDLVHFGHGIQEYVFLQDRETK